MFDQFTEYGANFNDGKVDIKYFQKAANITLKLLYLKVLGNLRIMNTNIKFLFKTSHAALILNRNFTFVFVSVYVRDLQTS